MAPGQQGWPLAYSSEDLLQGRMLDLCPLNTAIPVPASAATKATTATIATARALQVRTPRGSHFDRARGPRAGAPARWQASPEAIDLPVILTLFVFPKREGP